MPSRGELQGQDWTSITFTRPPTAQTQRLPHTPSTPAKTDVGVRKTVLEAQTEGARHESSGRRLAKELMQARTAKQMTQRQLAGALNVPVQRIVELERGTAFPDNALIARMSRLLGVRLSRAT